MQHLVGILIIMLAAASAACSQSDKEQPLNSIVNSSLESMEKESLPGAKLTHRKCGTCHYMDRNIVKVGPPLKGIVGRAPSISGVPFAVWDEAALDRWLQDPTGIKPGTMMAIPGITSAKDRAAIIEYLKRF